VAHTTVKTRKHSGQGVGRRAFLAGVATAGGAALLRPPVVGAQRGTRRYHKPVIDAHVHWYPREFADLLEKEGAANGATVTRNEQGFLVKTPGGQYYSPRGSSVRFTMMDTERMLRLDDERSVDMSVLVQTNPHVIWAPPEFGLRLARAINDATSALRVKHPTRFTGAITLPLQDVKLSLAELERARKLPGLPVVNFTESVNGKNLGDESFWPLYERIEALGMPIFLKNVNPIHERLIEKNYSMINVLGNPFEATIAATSLVLSGVMDEFPKLDVYLPHAGGFFAFVTPRIDWSMGTAGVRAPRAEEQLQQREAGAGERLPAPVPLRPDHARSAAHEIPHRSGGR
jgi:aminocarboxymuconate-semialdehyde decarboxylase